MALTRKTNNAKSDAKAAKPRAAKAADGTAKTRTSDPLAGSTTVSEHLEPFQILRPDGTIAHPELVPDLEFVEELYRRMSRARYFDDRMEKLVQQNRMGKYAQFGGQEASQIGSVMALQDGDYIAPMYRSTGALLTFGWSMQKALMYWRGHPEGWRIPDKLNMMPIIIDIAAQFPHAAGVAMGLKMQGKKNVCISYIGEGGTSQGDFHAGINFAAATDSPAVFVIENNGWAISVPRAVQSKADYLVRRAEGFGIPGYLVDGNDVLAVYHVTKRAVQHARAGNGPSLLENMTYRLRPHTTGDDPKAYRDENLTKQIAATTDPIARVKTFLEKQNAWNEDREAAMMADIESEFSSALEAADKAAPPDPRALLEYALANPTPALEAQMRELEARIKLAGGQA